MKWNSVSLRRRTCVAGLVLLLIPSFIWAQTTNAIISGTVSDETGGVLPGVSVTVINTETGISRDAVTDDSGRYSIAQLALGSYEVRTDLSGFKTTVRSGITVTVGREAVVNITLSVGDISEEVFVSGEAPMVDTTTSAIGGLVDDKKIRDLPLNGRNFAQLALLQTGVAFYNSESSSAISGSGMKFSVNGGRPNTNNFMMDGMNMADAGNSTPGGATGQSLGVEAIREFSVLTNTYSAAYGRNSGGIINIVTKSGTNNWHGSVYEFHRNSALDAKNFFDRPDEKIPHFIRNQFGFTIGGPIRQDRTFIFFNYEGLREDKGLTYVAVTPNENARLGLLPVVDQDGNPTGELVDVGLHPEIPRYLDLYPLPNGDDLGDGTGELFSSPNQPTDEDFFTVRLDHQFSSADSMFVRYSFDEGTLLTPDALGAYGEDHFNRTQLITIQEKHIFSPMLINTATGGYNRAFLDFKTSAVSAAAADPALEFIPGRGFGRLTVGQSIFNRGALPLLGTVAPAKSAYNTYQFSDDLRWTKGNHSIQVGVNVSRLQNNVELLGFSNSGFYIFGGLSQFLQAQATLFFGTPDTNIHPQTGEVISNDRNRGFRQTNYGFYIQDDFKVRPDLTLNLGLRYEGMTTVSEVNGRESNLLDPLDSAWTTGVPIFNNPGRKAFQPRIGMAWDVTGDGKTALRAGVGIFHDILIGVNYIESGGWTFPWSGFTNIFLLFEPKPSMSFPQPQEAFPGAFTPIAIHLNPDVKYPTRMHFNLNIQRELMADTTLTLAYVGSKSTHLTRRFDANPANATFCPCADDPATPGFDESTLAPGTKFFPAGSRGPTSSGPRRNPNFDLNQETATDGNGTYHSFQLALNRRFSSGLQFQASYTLSKAIDDVSQQLGSEGASAPQNTTQFDNRKAGRSFANWDVRNNFSFNFTWDLPFGSGTTGAARQLASGWTINSILTFTDGSPFTVTTGANFSRDATNNSAEYVKQAPGGSNNPVLGEDHTEWFDVTAFVPPELGTYGDVSRNTVRGPGFSSVDFSVVKLFPIREEMRFQFRAEFFNLFNRPNWGRPNSLLFNTSGGRLGSAGRIVDTVNTSRQIQFALKFLF